MGFLNEVALMKDKILKSPILEIDNLSVMRSGKLILKDINMTVDKGEFIGIVGPNGSGKSTLLLTILGVFKGSRRKHKDI